MCSFYLCLRVLILPFLKTYTLAGASSLTESREVMWLLELPPRSSGRLRQPHPPPTTTLINLTDNREAKIELYFDCIINHSVQDVVYIRNLPNLISSPRNFVKESWETIAMFDLGQVNSCFWVSIFYLQNEMVEENSGSQTWLCITIP